MRQAPVCHVRMNWTITGPWHFPFSSWKPRARSTGSSPCRGHAVLLEGLCSSSWTKEGRGWFLVQPQDSRWCQKVWFSHGLVVENSYRALSLCCSLCLWSFGLQNTEENQNNQKKKEQKKKEKRNPANRPQTQTFWLVHSRLFFIPLITATNILLSLEENVVIPQSDVFTFTSIIAWYILTLVKTYVF